MHLKADNNNIPLYPIYLTSRNLQMKLYKIIKTFSISFVLVMLSVGLADANKVDQYDFKIIITKGMEVGNKGQSKPNLFIPYLEQLHSFTPASKNFIIEAFLVGAKNSTGHKRDGWLAMNLIKYISEIEEIASFLENKDLDIDAAAIKIPDPGRRLRSMLRHFPNLEKSISLNIQKQVEEYTELSLYKLDKIVEFKEQQLIIQKARTARAKAETARKTEELIRAKAKTLELLHLNSVIENLYFKNHPKSGK